MIKKWKIIKSEPLSSNRVFSTRKDTSVSPITGEEHEFFVIEAPDWVNVVAVTDGDEVLLIRQYRHGIESETIEIPGGCIDPAETPLEAAKRELLEETGYVSDDWSCIGRGHPESRHTEQYLLHLPRRRCAEGERATASIRPSISLHTKRRSGTFRSWCGKSVLHIR